MKPTLEALPSHVPLSCLLPLLNASTAQIKCRGPRASDWRQRIKRRCPRASGLPNHVPLLTYCLVLKPSRRRKGQKVYVCKCWNLLTNSPHFTHFLNPSAQPSTLLHSLLDPILYSTPPPTLLHALLYPTRYSTSPCSCCKRRGPLVKPPWKPFLAMCHSLAYCRC